MNEIERHVLEILHNVNWLIESHDSYAELVEIKGKKIVIRTVGPCDTCDTDCIGTAFMERMPDMKLIRQ